MHSGGSQKIAGINPLLRTIKSDQSDCWLFGSPQDLVGLSSGFSRAGMASEIARDPQG
jgi:hypothetical protein